MAGSGWKVFQAGAVLPASEVNGYLMDQSVMVFAGTAARGSAIGTAASEGMMSYRTDENVLETFDGSQWVPSTAMTPTSLTGRNLLYNSAMQVAQRGTSTASINAGGYYTADRWELAIGTMGTWTESVENDAPTGTGLRKSLKILCTTAKASPASTDAVSVIQKLEGQDVQRIAKGTASAQKLTLSFWVKSNVTGTYAVELNDNDNGRFTSLNYTIASSGTWERKVVTFPADTTGVLDNDNALSLYVRFWLGAGSGYTSGAQQTGWVVTASTLTSLAPGQVNVAAATNNYWQITGVQLEVGPVATPFEFESFGDTLRKCLRYYEKSYADGVAPGTNTNAGLFFMTQATDADGYAITHIRFSVPKRTAPSIKGYTETGTADSWRYIRSATGTSWINQSVGFDHGSSKEFRAYILAGGAYVGLGIAGHWIADAEL